MAVLETVSLAKTTTVNDFTPFADDDLWVVDGIFTVTTNALTVAGAAPGGGQAGTSFSTGTQFGVRLVNLRQVLVKPTVGGAHGTLTFFGTVTDRAGLNELLRSRLGAT